MTGIVPMAACGAVTSMLAPGLVLLSHHTERVWDWDRLALPAAAALPLFVAGHATITITLANVDLPDVSAMCLHVLLLLGAIVYWLPVLGRRHRLSDPARSAYLFLSAPVLDLAGVWLVAQGDSPGGLAMIVAMLPIGLMAVVVTWRWISREERLAVERGDGR